MVTRTQGRAGLWAALAGLTGLLVACGGGPMPGVLESSTARAVSEQGDDPYTVAPDAASVPATGAKDPLVVVSVFTDFQCPYCSRIHPLARKLVQTWPNDVQVQIRHLPLRFHQRARTAAKATLAAHRQDRFWDYAHALFERQDEWKKGPDDESFVSWLSALAGELGLDTARFATDIADKALDERLDHDLVRVRAMGVNATPSVMINGRKVNARKGFYKETMRMIGEDIREGLRLLEEGTPRSVVPEVLFTKHHSDLAASILLYDDPPADDIAIPPPPPPEGRVAVELRPDDAMKGATDDALVTLVLFSDFECPFCSRANQPIEAVLGKYPRDVRVVFKHLPLSFHPRAEPAAIAAECARRQGKFWAFHDTLFDHQKDLDDGDLEGYAKKVGLDMAAYESCIADSGVRGAGARRRSPGRQARGARNADDVHQRPSAGGRAAGRRAHLRRRAGDGACPHARGDPRARSKALRGPRRRGRRTLGLKGARSRSAPVARAS